MCMVDLGWGLYGLACPYLWYTKGMLDWECKRNALSSGGRWGVALLAITAMGCGSSGDTKEEEPEVVVGNPLVPQVAAYPFPCDFYLEEDSSSATGKQVVIPQSDLPSGIPSRVLTGIDGFSRLPIIATYLEGGVDPASLLALDDAAGSVSKTAPVVLIEEGTWALIPVLAEADLTAPVDSQRALLIRPLQLLDADKGYVVVLRDSLRSYEGKAFERSEAFASLLENTPSEDAKVEKQRGDFELVREALSEAEIPSEEVVLAWSFHTRSAEQVTQTLLDIQDLANTAEINEYTIISDTVEKQAEGSNRQIVGSFKAPNFIGEDKKIARAADGKPEQRGTRDVEFSITIPSTVSGPRPVILYGHGFFGSYRQATRGSVNDIGHEYQFSSVGTNIGFNEDNETATLAGVTDLTRLGALVADVQQNIANQTSLVRLVREVLANDIEEDRGQGPVKVLDPALVHYYGISNGGTFGFLATATSPQFDRAALMVGGGGLMHFLERAVQWSEFSGIINQVFREARERQLAFSIIQMLIDPIDPINYSRHLVHDRYPGRKEMSALVVMAVNDSQVRNLVTEWVARSAKLPLVVPSPKEIYGLETASADGEGLEQLGGFFVYDEQVTPSPLGNLPPAEDNDTHGTSRYIPAFRKQLGTFLETRKLIQFCDGPCDPE